MKTRGFTLIELLAALAIAATMAYLAQPSFTDLLERVRTTSRVNGLIGVIRFARQTAITQRRWITLCPAVAEDCLRSREWHRGIMLFADLNRDGSRQAQEPIVGYQPAYDPGERLIWRAFRNRNYLQFRTEGFTNWQNGSFLYCPASGDPRYGKVVIINIQGRAAVSIDQDGDGIDEQASGDPLAC